MSIKNSPMKIKQLFLILFLFVVPALPAIADSIGFSFNSDRDNTAMDENDSGWYCPIFWLGQY